MMRNLTLALLALLLTCARVHAQNDFAPLGACWYKNMTYGSFRDSVQDLVLKQGRLARHITRKAIVTNPSTSPPVNDLADLYVYQSGDTVFAFNHFFDRFTPLYVFNAAEGDTVSIPIYPIEGGDEYQSVPGDDSLFHFVIDSVRVRLFGSASLRVFYNHSIDTGRRKTTWGNFQPPGSYAELLGGLVSGFTPQCAGGCVNILVESLQNEHSVRCYHDATHDIKLVSGRCDARSSMSVAPVPSGASVRVFPNPASDAIRIEAAYDGQIRHLSICNAVGALLVDQEFRATVPVSALPEGIYWLQLRLEDGSVLRQKLLIAR